MVFEVRFLAALILLALSGAQAATPQDLQCPVQVATKQIISSEFPDLKGNAQVVLAHPFEPYLVVATDQGYILKVHKNTLAVNSSLFVDQTFLSGVMWSNENTVFLGTQGFPASIHRISLSPFQHVDTLHLDSTEPEVSDLLLVPSPDGHTTTPRLIATIRGVPAKVLDIALQHNTFNKVSEIKLFQAENFARGAEYNRESNTIVVLTDSSPPSVVELRYSESDDPKANRTLERAAPFKDTVMPLKVQGIDIFDLSMFCPTSLNGDHRMFVGGGSQVIAINASRLAQERERSSTLGRNYITDRTLINRVNLNQGHVRSRVCAHDTTLHRLYVGTAKGLLAYDTAVMPFGLKEAKGSKCGLTLEQDVFGISHDSQQGLIFVASTNPTTYKPWIHRLQVVPTPKLDQVTGVYPTYAPVSSRRRLTLTGSEFTTRFPTPVEVSFVLLDSVNPAPVHFPATFVSQHQLTLDLPDDIPVGEYSVAVTENNKAFSSNPVRFVVYNDPTLLSVSPPIVRVKGGNLVSIVGRGFVDTKRILVEFSCAGKGVVVNGTFVANTKITARAPEMAGPCGAVVRVSLNGLDWVSHPAGIINFVSVSLTSVDPPVVNIQGNADFEIHGMGFLDSEPVTIGLKPKSLAKSANGYNVTGAYNEQGNIVYGKTKPFSATGLYALDLFVHDVKLTESHIHLEVVNVTATGVSPAIVTSQGGVDVSIVGQGFPKHNHISVTINPVARNPAFSEIRETAEVNEEATKATFRLPALPPQDYRLTILFSETEEIVVPVPLTVHDPLSFAVADSPKCLRKGNRGSVTLVAAGEVGLLSGRKGGTLAVKFMLDSSSAMAHSKPVVAKSFFDSVESVVSSSQVQFIETSGNTVVNASAKFLKAGRSYRPFVTVNGEEYHRCTGTVYSYEFTPTNMHPAAGPTTGATSGHVQGTGHMTQCGGVSPQVRFVVHVPGREGANWHVETDARVIDATTMLFKTPPAPSVGIASVDISIDGTEWLPLPKQLPQDNFVFYKTNISSVTPRLLPSTGTTVKVRGSGFPDTGAVFCKFGSDSRPIEAVWESSSLVTCPAPNMTAGQRDFLITFNGENWKNLLGKEVTVYSPIEETELGISPVAGPISGGTSISVTMVHGAELNKRQAALQFACDSETVVVSLAGLNPQTSTPTDGPALSTFEVTTPSFPIGCSVEISVARNGVDFLPTGHHFMYYDTASGEVVARPTPLTAGEEVLFDGSGFVNSGDEMAVRFSNANPTSNSTSFITAQPTFVDDSQLSLVVPNLSPLWRPDENKRAKVELSFNKQQWLAISVPIVVFEG